MKNKKGFTLVEVIVTVLIISIIATIGFLNFGTFSQEGRDTVRYKEIKTISNLLEQEISTGQDIPLPDGELITETYEIGGKTYTFDTGKFGETKNDFFRGKLSNLPLDPNGGFYKYSVSKDGKYYILSATLENGEEFKLSNLNDGGNGLLATVRKKDPTQPTNRGDSELDNNPPVFSVSDGQVINVSFGGYANINQITAVDDKPGTITYKSNPQTVVTNDQTRKGGYDVPVRITATDASGNSSNINVIFRVGRKYSLPVFYKQTEEVGTYITIKLNPGESVNHADITAIDEIDGNLTVTRSGDVQVNTPGEYLVIYTATNSGNTTKQLTVKYVVKLSTNSNLKENTTDERCFNYIVLQGKTVMITGMKSICEDVKDIDIPITIDGKPVTEINANVFKQKGIKTLNAPSIKKIGNAAFQSNQLTSISLPSVTSIGDRAFGYNKLTSIDLPSVTSIGRSAFESNQLKSIDLPSVTSIGDWAFGYNKLKSINLPSVTSIGEGAFYSNQLTSIDLQSVTSIGHKAFYSNQLTSINLPSITNIGSWAFYSNQLTSINLPSITNIGNRAFGANKINYFYLPKLKVLESLVFGNNNFGPSITIPANITEIRSGVFSGNGIVQIFNQSVLTEEQIKQAFDYNGVREYNGECRDNGQAC